MISISQVIFFYSVIKQGVPSTYIISLVYYNIHRMQSVFMNMILIFGVVDVEFSSNYSYRSKLLSFLTNSYIRLKLVYVIYPQGGEVVPFPPFFA